MPNCYENEIILETKGIVKDFPGQRALDGVDFDICKGEVHALVGENGAGKSTLIKIIAGVYRADRGKILINGEQKEFSSTKESQALGLSVIHQELNFVPHLSAAENILLGLKYPRNAVGMISYPALYKRANEIPDALHLGVDLRKPAAELSVIQQWKMAINRALALNSKIIFMDEPTASLSYEGVTELFRSIEHLKKSGKAIVYVSHRMEEIFEIADRVTVIKDAKKIGTSSVKEVNSATIFRKMLGRELKELYPEKVRPQARVRLEVKDLSRGQSVKGFNLTLRRGEIFGIAGLVGSGRTEVARLLFGADRKDKGQIYIDGKKVSIKSPRDAIRQGLVLVPEERRSQGVFLPMDIKQNITIGNLKNVRRWPLLPLISPDKESSIAQQYAKALEINTTDINKHVEFLSGGNQQKVVLAKWLATGAKIFIFDEPTRGIDVGAKLAIYDLVTKLAREGVCVIVISSDLTEVLGLCHRIQIISHGRQKAEFLADETDLSSVLRLCIGENGEALG